MTAVFKLSPRSLDQLEDELLAHAQRINAAQYAFLELLREFTMRLPVNGRRMHAAH